MKANEVTQKIIQDIRSVEARFLKKYPWARRYNFIGLSIFTLSIAGMILNAYLYWQGQLPAWAVIILNAILASFLHELEHDLIHRIYFKGQTWMQNLMLFGVWILRGNTVNPWFRRKIHLWHHRESGQLVDIEERLLGLGMPWSLRRFLLTIDPLMTLLIFRKLKREIPQFSVRRTFLAGWPTIPLFNLIWYSFIAIGICHLLDRPVFLEGPALDLLLTLGVAYAAPNVLRIFSLAFITTACHYYGDIERLNIPQQTQVLNKWYLWPLQIFCFNFGSTHIIHHFYVNQPFFLRQWMAKHAHRILKREGIRFNDLKATFFRANRFKAPLATEMSSA